MILADAAAGLGTIDSSGGVLTDLLSGYATVLNNGAQKIVDAETSVCGALLMLQFVVMVAQFGVAPGTLQSGLWKFLGAVVWYKIAINGVTVSGAWMSYMGSMGSTLGGGDVNPEIMRNPSELIVLAFKADDTLVARCLSYPNPFTAIFALFFYSVAGIFIFIGLAGLGIVVVVVGIMSGMDVVVGLMMVPFLIEPQMKFIGAKGLGMIMDGGISLACTSLAIGVAYGRVNLPFPAEPDFKYATVYGLSAMASFCICGGIAWFTKSVGMVSMAQRMFG